MTGISITLIPWILLAQHEKKYTNMTVMWKHYSSFKKNPQKATHLPKVKSPSKSIEFPVTQRETDNVTFVMSSPQTLDQTVAIAAPRSFPATHSEDEWTSTVPPSREACVSSSVAMVL